MKRLLILSVLVVLSACASIVEGTDQSIMVSSHPSDALCSFQRDGGRIASIRTPGTIYIEKSKNDIFVRCSKTGYTDGTAVLASEFEGMTAGNVLFGGFVGLAIDAGSGAMYNYPTSITVVLTAE